MGLRSGVRQAAEAKGPAERGRQAADAPRRSRGLFLGAASAACDRR